RVGADSSKLSPRKMIPRLQLSACRAKPQAANRSPPAYAEDLAGILVFPDDLAVTIHFKDALRVPAGGENMAVGQFRRHRRARRVHFRQRLTLAVELHDLVASSLRDEDAIVRQQIETAQTVAVVIDGETLELLPGRIQEDALAVVRQAEDDAFARTISGQNTTGDIVDRVNLFTRAIHFEDLVCAGDECVAVGEPLHVDGTVDLFLPKNLAREIAFGDAVGIAFGDEYTIARQHDGIDGTGHVVDGPAFLAVTINLEDAASAIIANNREAVPRPHGQASQIDAHAVDLPPGGPGIAILFALGRLRAGRHIGSRIPRELIQRVLDLADLLERQHRDQIDQHRDALALLRKRERQGDAQTHLRRGIAQ